MNISLFTFHKIIVVFCIIFSSLYFSGQLIQLYPGQLIQLYPGQLSFSCFNKFTTFTISSQIVSTYNNFTLDFQSKCSDNLLHNIGSGPQFILLGKIPKTSLGCVFVSITCVNLRRFPQNLSLLHFYFTRSANSSL